MNTMQKSKIDVDEFYHRWYNSDEDITADDIEDAVLRDMYVSYLALEQDQFELQEKIERYLDANSRHGRYIYEAGNEDVDSEPNKRRPELTH